MRHDHRHWSGDDPKRLLRPILALVVAGLALAAFLAAIGHPEWFRLRPVSSAASAMSAASNQDQAA